MKHLMMWTIANLVLTGFWGSLCAQEPGADAGLRALQSIQLAFQRAIEKARPSVVALYLIDRQQLNNFNSERSLRDANTNPSSNDFAPASMGSGIVVGKAGLILTCYHVIKPALSGQFEISVMKSTGKSFRSAIYAADPRSDLAVVRVLDQEEFRPIEFGHGEKVFAGQFVLSLGNPFGSAAPDGDVSASWGIISNIRRRPKYDPIVIHSTGTLIQTDTRLNMGTSGGALVDLEGRLIGVTMALAAMDGFESPGGFAVPTNELTLRTIEALRQGREMEYGFLGIQPQSISPAEAEQLKIGGGVRVVSMVSRFIDAARDGLREADIITKINGKQIKSHNDLILAVGSLPAGSVMQMEVFRGTDPMNLSVSLSKYPVVGKVVATVKRPAWRGIRVDYLSTLIPTTTSLRFGFYHEPLGTFGVAVREVEPENLSAKQALQVQRIITKINGKEVQSPDEFDKTVSELKGTVTLTLYPNEEVMIPDPNEKNNQN